MSRPPELLRALGPVADALEALAVPYFVTGSIASSVRGLARASIDVDLVADLGPEKAARFAGLLRGSYYVSEEAVRDAARERSSFNVIHLETMLKVDVFVADASGPQRAALARARPERLDEESPRTFPVATAEDVILAKLRWFRLGGERSERQWTDVLGVLRAAATGPDLTYLREQAIALGVEDLLARAVSEATTAGA